MLPCLLYHLPRQNFEQIKFGWKFYKYVRSGWKQTVCHNKRFNNFRYYCPVSRVWKLTFISLLWVPMRCSTLEFSSKFTTLLANNFSMHLWKHRSLYFCKQNAMNFWHVLGLSECLMQHKWFRNLHYYN